MKKEIVISGRDLSIGYTHNKKEKNLALYSELSFDLIKGELVCLIGSNGAGKSTLLRTVGNMQPALSGEVKVLNKEISKYGNRALSRVLGVVLTDKTTSGGFTVREVVELGRYPYTGFWGQLDDEDKQIVEKSLQDVGILHKADSFLADLSDGERQKVMIAKALSQECPIIILDEPTAFLDVESRIEIMSLLHNLAHKHEKTILLSTHDIDLAFLLADKLWLLSKRNGLITGVTEDIILSGTIDHFFSNKNITFNKYSGSFYPLRSSDKKIFVDAQEEYLFWTINLLLRLNLDYATKQEDAIFSIRVTDYNTIEVIREGQTTQLKSYEELATYLRNAEI